MSNGAAAPPFPPPSPDSPAPRGAASGAAAPRASERAFLLLFVAPVLLLLGSRVLPLVTGARTLYLRDVFGTHLEMKAAQAEAMREGRLPLVDPYRAGGMPALGNPDSVPLYPDNLLYMAAPPLWALNAHFWVHLLLAPFAFFWLGRAWGLRREAAWAAGVSYALSGYFLSHLTLYNQVAGAALAPALAAACLGFAEGASAGRPRRWAGPVVAVLWALLLLGGEPLMAALALLLSLSAVAARHGPRRAAATGLLLALVCGTLLAAPQIVEFLRIVGPSYRGHLGYPPETRTVASWDPRQVVEWLLPFVFGRPDRIGPGQFWGRRFFTDRPPYYFSLYPGLLALALAITALRSGGRVIRWPLGCAAAGLLLALGRFNPPVAWLFEAGRGLVRYPVRLWLAVAMGGALLAGIGFERCVLDAEPRARKALRLALLGIGSALLLLWLAIRFASGPFEGWLAGLLPDGSPPGAAAAEVRRWGVLCLLSLALVALLAPASILAARLPREGGALLLTLHAAAQIVVLAPLSATDSTAAYRTPSPLVQAIPLGATAAHGASEGLFGSGSPSPARYPGPEGFWLARRAFHEAYPFAGALFGRRYELNVSSEGLDPFLSTAARDAVRLAGDADRLRLLAAWGVGYLVLDRPLDSSARDLVEPVSRLPSFGGAVELHGIRGAAPPALVAGTIRRAPHLNAAVASLKDPAFDPRVMVVLPGDGPPLDGPPGEARILGEGPERLIVETDAPAPGVLVLQRSWLPLYRATLDGAPVPIGVANLHRLGVEVPPGRHRVEIRTDRRPLGVSLAMALVGLAGLVGLFRLAGGPGRAAGSAPAPVR